MEKRKDFCVEMEMSEEERSCVPMLRDNMHAYVERGEIEIYADDYRPEGDFDIDELEARQGRITAPIGRSGWKIAYRIARALIRNGKVNVLPQGVELALPCNTEISFC